LGVEDEELSKIKKQVLMTNPYSSPETVSRQMGPAGHVQAPAIALIVVSLIAALVGMLGLIGDFVFIVTGMVERLEAMNDGPISEYTQITIRVVWGIVLEMAALFVLYGAIKMKNLQNFPVARAASVVAMIPMIGPCCLVGIPFGIWAFIALGKPGVRDSFS
jgi:hypothetical protein